MRGSTSWSMHLPTSQIASTYKGKDVEEILDRLFYRPAGYLVARLSRSLTVTPTTITLLSIVLGVIAGRLFYYPDTGLTVLGMVLLVTAEAFDSADGQLARMTGRGSKLGRILDGMATNIIFLSIYGHLCARIIQSGGPLWIVAVAFVSAISHSIQCAASDYFRNAYLWYVDTEHRGELDQSAGVRVSYRALSWRTNPVKKALLRIYLNYTSLQELLTATFRRLFVATRRRFGATLPDWLRADYARQNKPLLKYYNLITSNTRMIALFVALLVKAPVAYFLFELLVLNGVLLYVTLRQNRVNNLLLEEIRSK